MAEFQPIATEARLYEFFRQAVELGQEQEQPTYPSDTAAPKDRITVLTEKAADSFIGKSVRIVPIDRDTSPITAFYYATPYPLFGTPGYKPQGGVIVRKHPRHATGTIEELSPVDATLKVRPRALSPYRASKGYFSVNVFDVEDLTRPLVAIEFVR